MRSVAIAACTLALTACSSGGSKGPTRIEYAHRADAICAEYNHETARLRGRSSGVQGLARVAERTLALLDHASARLRALAVPHDERAAVRRWLASLQRLRIDVVRIRDAARANDLAAVRAVATTAERDNDASNALARRLGLVACSSG
jgi:hypothetical protein